MSPWRDGWTRTFWALSKSTGRNEERRNPQYPTEVSTRATNWLTVSVQANAILAAPTQVIVQDSTRPVLDLFAINPHAACSSE